MIDMREHNPFLWIVFGFFGFSFLVFVGWFIVKIDASPVVIFASICVSTVVLLFASNKLSAYDSIEHRKYLFYKSLVGEIIQVDKSQALLIEVTKMPPTNHYKHDASTFWICYIRDNKQYWTSSHNLNLIIDGVKY